MSKRGGSDGRKMIQIVVFWNEGRMWMKNEIRFYVKKFVGG